MGSYRLQKVTQLFQLNQFWLLCDRCRAAAHIYSRKGLLEVRKQVGIVAQEPDNQLFFCGCQTGTLLRAIKPGYSQEETRAKVDAIIAQLSMETLQDKPTHFLSGGEKASCHRDILIKEPEIIILDEPDSAWTSSNGKKSTA